MKSETYCSNQRGAVGPENLRTVAKRTSFYQCRSVTVEKKVEKLLLGIERSEDS